MKPFVASTRRAHARRPRLAGVRVSPAALLLAMLATPAGCLDRPVAPQQPSTSDASMQLYRSQKVEKIDLLFMIDNSASMGDKQQILAAAVPDLVQRLTNPVCVELESREFVARVGDGEDCPAGSEREFDPVKDIHIGVISSSIGGHGSDQCVPNPKSNPTYNPRHEDMSHLVTRGKTVAEVPTYAGKGYLQWDPEERMEPPGQSSSEALIQDFTQIVGGTGEDGCGYEASLESWYRFLVDPAPYERMVPAPCFEGDVGNSCRAGEGIDGRVLRERADFVRPDSLLAVIMLTDENDCSVIDGGQYFFALQDKDGDADFHRARATAACEADPWAPDCKSCWEVDHALYPECAKGWDDAAHQDPINLRCFNQKKRFGINFLYPIKRYVDGLTQKTLPDGTLNPVFCTRFAEAPDPNDPSVRIIDRTKCEEVVRDESMVFLGGIVGVPWQDIARDPNDLTQGYLPAERLAWTSREFAEAGESVPAGVDDNNSLWNVMLGEVDKKSMEIVPTSRPLDPLMIESVEGRSGTQPATGARLAEVPIPPEDPSANPVNGFERAVSDGDDLQYACIFKLPEPVECTSPTCDCTRSPESPLCWSEAEKKYGTMQYRAKAYPGTRQLAVLKGLGAQAIVASICAANVRDLDPSAPGVQVPEDKDWGYRPAISAVVDRLKGALQGQCWNRQLEPNSSGEVQCVVIEATKGDVDDAGKVVCPPCEGIRTPANEMAKATLESDDTYRLSGLHCACELAQADVESGALQACVEQRNPDSSLQGWCYVDPERVPASNAELVAGCPVGSKRMIRFMGEDVPKPGALTYLQCRGGVMQEPAPSGSSN